jgi:hypothetical protein
VGERTTPFYGFDVALVDDDTGTFDDYGYIMAFPHYKYIDDKLVQIDRLRSEA